MDMSSIGKNIRKKRLAKSWKQEVLASKVEVTASYIGMIEKRFPDWKHSYGLPMSWVRLQMKFWKGS